MSKEPSWADAAYQIMASVDTAGVWCSVPYIIREIKRIQLKDLSEMKHGQACRSARSAIHFHSRKENGQFVRMENEKGVFFALRKRLRSQGKTKGAPSLVRRSHSHSEAEPLSSPVNGVSEVTNCLPPSGAPPSFAPPSSLPTSPPPVPLLPPSPPHPFTVEIDPQTRPLKGRRDNHGGGGGGGGFCLPSPLLSLLGPRRTLHVLSESAPVPLRPVRKARQKSWSRADDEAPTGGAATSNGCPDLPSPLLTTAELRTPVLAHCADVSFVKTDIEGDPASVQGERTCLESLEISPDGRDSDSEGSSTDDDETDSDDRTGDEDFEVVVGPTPTSQLLTRRPSALRMLLTPAGVAPVEPEPLPSRPPAPVSRSAPGKSSSSSYRAPSERPGRRGGEGACPAAMRGTGWLFQPTSPLATETVKPLLTAKAFAGFTPAQRCTLTSCFPSADQATGEGGRPPESAFTNTFFTSALRDWQARLALGAFTSEGRARATQEKKRCSLHSEDVAWKEKHYEDYWGEKAKDKTLDSTDHAPYFPTPTAAPPTLHLRCLSAIRRARRGPSPDHAHPPSPPPQTPPPVHPPSTAATTVAAVNSPLRMSKPPAAVKKKSTHSVVARNHTVLKRPGRPAPKPVKPVKGALKAVNSRPLAISKPVAATSKTSNKKPHLGKRASPANKKTRYLSPLPSKTPYPSLLHALEQACRSSPAPSLLPPSSPYKAPPAHTHPVFFDHFSLLSAEHVPLEFSEPVTSLVVRWPRSLLTDCLRRKTVLLDHNYVGGAQKKTCLRVSLPLSLSSFGCVCSRAPLTFCPLCRSLYHASCSNRCPGCMSL